MATETKNTKAFYNTEIPSDWDVKPVGEAFKICNNLRLPISEEERAKMRGTYPYYGPTKIQDYINEFRLDGKYALIGEDGDHFLKWKELPMTLIVEGKFNVNNHAHIILGEENLTEWFFYFFNQRELTPHLTRQGAGRYKLTKDALSKILCPLPPLPEQKAIAQVLSTADAAIHTTEKLIAQKELRKKWLMQQLLTGKKWLKGFGGEWKEKKLEYFIKDYKHKPTDEDTYEVLTSAKAGLMKQTDYYGDNRITNRDDADYNVIPPNYLTYRSRSDDGLFTFNKNDLGITGLISGYYPVFTIKNGDINFILMYMNYFRQKLTKYAIGTSQLVLAMNALKEAKFHLPLEEEQTAIAQVLQAADKEISLLKTKAEKLREQKKWLMQVLLTGKVRLKINDKNGEKTI
jgi:type I restriction enzyme S subunit